MKRMQHEESTKGKEYSMEKVQHEKGQYEENMKRIQYEK